ncbi:epidermal differentiation-specific protein-like [Pyxicephalus adspersus]|uniref:epidermal differentiation-specific protein-like n=1 Tax=Pyxicephalus adspersus TaxID=30357 RepID=UPI003B5A05B2
MANSIELFEFPNFNGKTKCITGDTDISFTAKSIKVHGDPWILFTVKNGKEELKCLEKGNYSSVSDCVMRSMRVVNGGLSSPQITLYERSDYQGRSLMLNQPAKDLSNHSFSDSAASHRDVQGAWILYSGQGYTGNYLVTVAGDEITNYTKSLKDNVSSLKPVEAYKP